MRFLKTAKKRFSAIRAALLLAAALIAGAGPAHGREITDATQTRVSVSAQPRRVVTLAPSLGELAADVLSDEIERIVGVSEYTDYPPGLKHAASVGPYSRFNLEKVVALKPDLVLATLDGNPKDQIEHLRELGLSVVVVGTENFEQVGSSMKLVADSLGYPERGARMAAQLSAGIARIRERAQALPHQRVLLQVGDEPLVVVGKGSFLHEALETVGGVNVYADASAHYPRPAVEDALHRDPELIVVLALGKDLKPFYAMARRWERFHRRVHVLRGDPVVRPTLRLLEGLALLEKSIHDPR